MFIKDGLPLENITSELEMSKALVREYVAIAEGMTNILGRLDGVSADRRMASM